MLVESDAQLEGLLICPVCSGPLSRSKPDSPWHCDSPTCSAAKAPFDQVDGKSLLFNFAASVVERRDLIASRAASKLLRRGKGWRSSLFSLIYGTNRVAPNFAREIIARLEAAHRSDPSTPQRLLIVGGGAVGSGADALYDSPVVDVVAFDIYNSDVVTFLADGHAIPLCDASVDAAWVQAVLEHVISPETVVAEIHRVLKPEGYLFADTPFLWPVHEKAYDFMRFTASGHRWLFRYFDVLAAGASSGPGTTFVLTLGSLAASLFRSSKIGHIAVLPFFWVRYLDALCDERGGLDAAAGLFFFGKRRDAPISVAELLAFYDAQVQLQQDVKDRGGR
jgi:SAM-dependent methyltransferase